MQFRPRRAETGPFFRAFGPEAISGPDQSGSFPETNFFAGDRQMAGCACALRAARFCGHGRARMGLGMSVATSLGLWVFLQAAGGGSGFTMLPILLIIPVLYLVMIRPQQKRQKQWQQMLASIKAGDRVTTAGGIRGIILSIKDDVIVIRVAPDGIKLEVAKNAIASVTTQDEHASS